MVALVLANYATTNIDKSIADTDVVRGMSRQIQALDVVPSLVLTGHENAEMATGALARKFLTEAGLPPVSLEQAVPLDITSAESEILPLIQSKVASGNVLGVTDVSTLVRHVRDLLPESDFDSLRQLARDFAKLQRPGAAVVLTFSDDETWDTVQPHSATRYEFIPGNN